MEFTAELELTEAYFAESYREWLGHRSRYRKWEAHLGIFVATAGIVVSLGRFTWIGLGLLVFGSIQIADFFLSRRNWLRERIESTSNNSDSSVLIRVNESGLYQKGPTSKGLMQWDGVKSASPTASGLFLIVGAGMSIYVPDAAMCSPNFKSFVIRMVDGHA